MARAKIPFELHLTASSIKSDKIDGFISICQKFGGKPLLIELAQGDFSQQPMFVKNLPRENLESVLKGARELANDFRSSNFDIRRIKIETDSKHARLFKKSKENYFEWHGKISLNNLESILKLCEKHKVHLSKNNLKNDENLRFITLREFGSKDIFQQKLLKLKFDLQTNGIGIFKETSEFCIYDDNQILDKGWLPD